MSIPMLRFKQQVEVRSFAGRYLYQASRKAADAWRRDGWLDLSRTTETLVTFAYGKQPAFPSVMVTKVDLAPDQDRFRDLSAQPGERPSEWLAFGTPYQRDCANNIIKSYQRCLAPLAS